MALLAGVAYIPGDRPAGNARPACPGFHPLGLSDIGRRRDNVPGIPFPFRSLPGTLVP